MLLVTVSPEAVARLCSVKKAFLEISQNSRENTCARVFFNKVAGLSPANLSKKRLWHGRFPVNFAKFLRTPFLTEHLRWLLLFHWSLSWIFDWIFQKRPLFNGRYVYFLVFKRLVNKNFNHLIFLINFLIW